MNRNILKIGALVIVVVVILGAVSYGSRNRAIGVPGVAQVGCTMEAKICPDGSSVGRTGPSCEFAACPDVTVTPSPSTGVSGIPSGIKEATVTAKLGETINMFGAHASVIEVVEDSRCPVNADCIQAGTVRVRTHATYGSLSQDVVLALNKPFTFGAHSGTLVDVQPVKMASHTIVPAEYVFTFQVR
jgi:hypothetical protein